MWSLTNEGSTPRAPADVKPGSSDIPFRDWDKEELDDLNPIALATTILKHWRLVMGLPMAAALTAAVIVLIIPPKYTGTASFIPETEFPTSALPGALLGLATQFGVGLPGSTESPRFYAQVLESRTVRDDVLQSKFPTPVGVDLESPSMLIDILKIDGDSLAERLEKGRRKLDDLVTVRVDDRTSMVAVSVKTRYRELSAQVANRFVELLNRFNLETRQSEAHTRRLFIEERLTRAEQELQAAENDVQQFLEGNRDFGRSPQLQIQFERLQRQVTIKQEVLITLRRQYEETRIQEVNDTPMLTVVDEAVPPVKKSSPKRTLTVIVTFFVFAIGSVFAAMVRDLVERGRRQGDSSVDEFTNQWELTKRDLRALLTRRRGSGGS